MEEDSLRLRVIAIGKEITDATRMAAERRMEQYGMENYHLRIIQGGQTDSILAYHNRLSEHNTTREAERHKLLELSAQIASLTAQLNQYTRLDDLSNQLRPEIKTLFPQVNTLGLSRMAETASDTASQQHYVIALIATAPGKPLIQADHQKLQRWLQTRISADSLVLIEK